MYKYCLFKNRKFARICLKNERFLEILPENGTCNWKLKFSTDSVYFRFYVYTIFCSVLTFGAENKWSTIKNKFQNLILLLMN